MSGNYAKRGRGSYNPNSRKAVRHDKKHTKDSDNSSSDGENTIQQKHGPSSSSQQNISGENTLTSSLKKSAAPSVPSHIASPSNVDASMHAPSNKDKQQPPNASPNLETNGAPSGDRNL
ncbi:hypothetical protein RhiirB3_448557 [Rhizophagus irregularis]|nr:hypothetical protein RhiirB3_448557 [Rhizophagus irregularis]